MSTGFFAGLSEEAGVSSFDSLPQSMRVHQVTNPSGPVIAQAMQQHGAGTSHKVSGNVGFPKPSGFAGPTVTKRY